LSEAIEVLIACAREITTPCILDRHGYNRCIEHHRDLPCEVGVLAEALKDYDKEVGR
jgi:hypothetical protein